MSTTTILANALLRKTGFIVASAMMAFVFFSQDSTADWPAFLGGIDRDRVQVELPTAWSESEGLLWKAPLKGHGQSSPIVVGDTVYVTAIDGPQKERNLTLAFDLNTGKQRWEHVFASSLQVKNDPYTSRAAPTAVADENGVIAFFESGDMVALSPEGKVIWERKLMEDYGKYAGQFGLGGSLAQLGERLFVLADNEGPSYLAAIDKKTGETLWKSDRTSRTAWSSPMILMVDGDPQVVVSSAGSVDGYSAAGGTLLWSLADVGGNTVASPIPFGNGRFLVGASPGRNGEESEGAKRSNMAVQVTTENGKSSAKVLWRNEEATSSFGSPIVYQGKAYYVNRAGGVFCIDAETGNLIYKARIAESTWATPVGNSGRVYFFGQSGDTTVIESGESFKELAVNRLWQAPADGGGPGGFNAEIQYGVALCDKGVLIRTGENLYLVGK